MTPAVESKLVLTSPGAQHVERLRCEVAIGSRLREGQRALASGAGASNPSDGKASAGLREEEEKGRSG
jgi:hypothetical protein